MYITRPIQPYHFQADLNWCDGTFKVWIMDAPKSILETEKPLKTLSFGQIYKKNPKNPKKNKKKKKTHWAVFFFLTRVFSQPCLVRQLYEGDAAGEEAEAAPLPGGQAPPHQEHGKSGRCQDFQLVGHLKKTKRLLARPAKK
jgi:hypothetical protein